MNRRLMAAFLGAALLCGCSRAQTIDTNLTATATNGTKTAGEATMKTKFSISEQGQAALLKIARESIDYYLRNGKQKVFDVKDAELTTPAAVFVTLTRQGQLRGCIGTTEPREAMHQAVSGLAVAAAVNDTRFRPLTLDELGKLNIEISVLSPLHRVKSGDEIQQNVHGVIVRKGFSGGLFLPQVWEHFETKAEFMDELCRQKAHLPADAWKDPKTELYVFTVFAFQEKE